MTPADDLHLPVTPVTATESSQAPAPARAKRATVKAPALEIGAESEVRGGPEAPLETLLPEGEAPFNEVDPALAIASEHEIRVRAYYLWQAAGEPEGSELEFWQQATAQMVK